MKKFIVALLTAVVGTTALAQNYWVYDYKASIKRMDYVLTARSGRALQYYKTASDAIVGYVAIPRCVGCEGPLAQSLLAEGGNREASFGYFKRSGDKLKLAQFVTYDPYVYVDSAMFGAALYHKNQETKEISGKNKYAWMKLSFYLGDNGIDTTTGKFIKNSGDALAYRFLGFSNTDAGEVVNTGFGTVSTSASDPTFSICGLPVDAGTNCAYIVAISGTLVGGGYISSEAYDGVDAANFVYYMDPTYSGICNATPIWDLCDGREVNKAIICGTWTLKFNRALSAKATAAAIKTAILAKLGAKDAQVFTSRETAK